MRKTILSLLLLAMASLPVFAATQLTVGDVSIPKGGEGRIDFNLETDQQFTAFSMRIALPEGITYQSWEENANWFGDNTISVTCDNNGVVTITRFTSDNTVMKGTNGWLLSLIVDADPSLAAGTILQGIIYEIEFTTPEAEMVTPNDMTFSIIISDNRTILDENSPNPPEASGGMVDVRVKRTINANEWSTIVLPFSMVEEKLTAAFGTDVMVGDFTSCTSEQDDDGNTVAIKLGFARVYEIEANHPYIIRITKAIDAEEGFTVDNVEIDPEDEPTVQVGKKVRERSYFIGSYQNDTYVPENNVFLSGNKFWYSIGATKMKGFRAYFDLFDVLSSVENTSNVSITWEDSTGLYATERTNNAPNGIYDLQGRKLHTDSQDMQKLQKGIYIINGKKVAK